MPSTHEVADRLGLALDNARLLEQVNRERDRLTFLYESARALAASLRQTDILNTALGFAPRVGAQHALILLTDDAAPGRATFPRHHSRPRPNARRRPTRLRRLARFARHCPLDHRSTAARRCA
ncbi:MAG: hypothetical protein FJ030_00650 [Chloroflexi bacterium]|nr:hypothetical protein [Chloroflexota bacterium]